MCGTPSVITLCLHTAWSCEDLSLESKHWSAQAELMTAYRNPICLYPTLYDFSLQVLQPAQGSVKQTQNPFIGWKSTREEEKASQARSHIISSATQTEPARWLFMCLTMIIIAKNVEIVKRKGNNSGLKLRKPSHNNEMSEILACLQRTCWLKLSAHRSQRQNKVLWRNPSSYKNAFTLRKILPTETSTWQTIGRTEEMWRVRNQNNNTT